MLRQLTSIGTIQSFTLLVSLARAKVLSLLLGPAGFGVVSTIDQVVLSVGQIGSVGLPFASLKILSRKHSEGNESFRQGYFGLLRLVFLAALAATVTAWLLLRIRPEFYGADLLPYRDLLAVAIVGAPALILNIYFANTLAAAQRGTASAGLLLVVTFSLAAAAAAGAWYGGIGGLYLAVVTTSIVTTLGFSFWLAAYLKVGGFAGSGGMFSELRRTPEVVSYSAMLYVALCAYSVMLLVIRYHVFSFLGAAQAGFLHAVLGISLALGAVLDAMNSLYLTPLLNRSGPQKEKIDVTHAFQRKILLILLAASLPALLFPKTTLWLLFSAEFVSASGVLFLFVFWQCLQQIVNAYQRLLMGLDDVWFFSWASAVGYALAAAMTPYLVSTAGLAGAAVALVLGVVLIGALCILRLAIRFGSRVPRDLVRLVVVGLAVIYLSGFGFRFVEEATAYGVLARIAYASMLAALVWKLLDPGERRLVKSFIRR